MLRKHKKAIFSVFYVVSGLFLFVLPVQAYVDPSVMTYAIQAVAGIVITLGTFVGIYWQKITRLFGNRRYSVLQQNAALDNLEFYDPTDHKRYAALDFLSEEEKRKKIYEGQKILKKQNTDYSFYTAVILSATISFLWMFFAPLQLQLTNVNEFKYDIYAVLPTLLLMFTVGFLTALLVYWIAFKINRKLNYTGIVIGFWILLGSYVQGNYLVGNLQKLDGSYLIWDGHFNDHIQSGVLWLVLLIIIVVLAIRLKEKGFHKTVNITCLILVLTLITTNIVSGINNGGFIPKNPALVTTLNEYTYSTDENFIILILDAADASTFQELIKTSNPEFTDILEDFTFYPDTVGCYPFTKHAIPYILTGEWMEYQEPFIEFETHAMDYSPLFNELEKRNYRKGLYEAELTYESDGVYRFENIIKGRYKLSNFAEYARSSFILMWYMYAPFALKKLFANPGVYTTLQHLAKGEKQAFSSENHYFYSDLQNTDIDLTDDKCFKFIHIDGAHVPFRFDANVNLIPMEEGSYELNYQAAMTITRAYLQKLKDAGVYDNSNIIIMADHGYDIAGIGPQARENPLLLIKTVGEHHLMEISPDCISYEQLQKLYVNLLDGKSKNQLFDETSSRNRRFISYDFMNENYLQEYYQTGYASDEESMIPSGEAYSPEHAGETVPIWMQK